MIVLHLGSRGPLVKQAQEALNAAEGAQFRLVPDGVFGPLTKSAVEGFQAYNWLVEDGKIGICTWNALMKTETYTPIYHDLPFIPQPNDKTCWAASTAMMTRSSVPLVIERTPVELINEEGALRNYSGQDDWLTPTRKFATAHALGYYPPQSWMVSKLRDTLARGPLMFDMLWKSGEYASGRASPGHMIVVIGIRGDDDESGIGTTVAIQDPWPPNVGEIYSVNYNHWTQDVLTRTYRVFYKL